MREDKTSEAKKYLISKFKPEFKEYIINHLAGDFAYALSKILKNPRPKCQECGRFVSDKELKKVPKNGVP